MAETKTVNLNVETNLGSLKTQLREAQQQVALMSEKFGATSVEAANAAKKAAELKDKIADAKALTDAFNPDAKFNALSSSIGGVLNGFQAYQGALGLVGVESKEVEKQLLAVQSAMALSQGLQGLGEARDSFKQLGAVAKNVFTGIKGAIGATGIGLLVVAVGALVSNWQELTKWVEKSFPAFAKIGDFFKNFRQVASGTINSVIAGFKQVAQVLGDVFRGDFSKALKDAKDVGRKMSEAYNKGFDEKDRQLKTERYIKQKTFELDLEKAKGKDILDEQLKLQRKQLSLLEKGSEEYKAKLIEIEETKTAIREREQSKQDKIEEEAQKRREKRLEEQAKRDKEEREKGEKHKQELIDNANDLNEALRQSDANREAEKIAMAQAEEERRKKGLALLVENGKKQKAINDQELADAKKLQAQKIQATQDTLTTIANLTELFAGKSKKQQEQAFKIQKAANIANATIDTYKAVNSAIASTPGGPVLKGIAGAVVLSAGLLNVKKIASQQFNSESDSSGGGAGSAPTSLGGGGVTPNFSIVGNNGQNQLTQLQQAPIQAYVVSGEMTTAQALDRNRLRNATL